MRTSKTQYSSYGHNSTNNMFQVGMTNSRTSAFSSAEMSPNQGFQSLFKERFGKLRWKEIMKMDIEEMVRNNDLSPLESLLENLIFSSVDENDLQIIPETSFVKLIKIYQYVLEYLLYSQQRLENENNVLERDYNQLVNDAMSKETQLKENKNLIHTLKKEKKQKEMVLNTYKCLVDEYKSGQLARDNKTETQSVTKKYFCCKICEGKKFSSEENLDAHMVRRHQKDVQVSQDFNNGRNPDNKIEEMKTFFETYLKNFHNESYMRIYENQKNLESKISEIKYEKTNDLKEMENHFKNTLVEMKELYLKNSINLIGNSYIAPQNMKRDSDDEEQKLAKKMKKETKKMNELLKEINKEQNGKIVEIMNQLSNFKQTITEEFKEIKEKEKDKQEVVQLRAKKDQKMEMKINSQAIDRAVMMEYTTNVPKKQLSQIRESLSKKSTKHTKSHFNSGPLESDHESDGERILKNKSLRITSTEVRNQDVKFSFAPSSLKVSLNKENELSPFSQQRLEDQRVKSLIVDNIERDISQISTRPQFSDSSIRRKEPEKIEELEEYVNKGEPEQMSNFEIVKNLSIKKEEERKSIKIEEIKQNLEKEISLQEQNYETVGIVDRFSKSNLEQEIALQKVKKFYHSFVERDNEAVGVDKPKFESLLVKIIPDLPQNVIESKMKTLLDTAAKHSSRINPDLKDISMGSSEEVVQMIDSILKNIQNLSYKREFFEVYYSNISTVIGLEECLSYAKNNKKNSRDNRSIYHNRTNSNLNINAKLIEREEVILSPIERIKNKQDPEAITNDDNQIEIIDDDGQFEHEM